MYKRSVIISVLLLTILGAKAATLNIHINNTSSQAVYVKILDKENYSLAYETATPQSENITSADANKADYFEISLPSETDPGECKINITQDKKSIPEKVVAEIMYNDPPILCMLPNGAGKVMLMPNKDGNYDVDVLVRVS